jgi:uncharacterized membrane protein YhiD involved in acid resistance
VRILLSSLPSEPTLIGRIALAAGLGALVGVERLLCGSGIGPRTLVRRISEGRAPAAPVDGARDPTRRQRAGSASSPSRVALDPLAGPDRPEGTIPPAARDS